MKDDVAAAFMDHDDAEDARRERAPLQRELHDDAAPAMGEAETRAWAG